MSSWYEVFDNETVQFETRRQVGVLTGFFMGAVVTTFGLVGAASTDQFAALAAIGVTAVLWCAFVVWGIRRLRQIRRVVWCVKLSDREIVGYDYARRKVRLDWTEVERVDVHEHGLVVVGPAQRALEVLHLFPEFATLSHRIVQYAEFYDRPIFVAGEPWEEVDVYHLFPFLSSGAASGTAHGPSN